MENNRATIFIPNLLPQWARKKNAFFFLSLIISIVVIFLLKILETSSTTEDVTEFLLIFLLTYLSLRIKWLREKQFLFYAGIVVTEKEIRLNGYYLGKIPRTILRSEIQGYYIKHETGNHTLSIINFIKHWIGGKKRLILIGKNGRIVATRNLQGFSEEDIDRLIFVLGAKPSPIPT